VWELQGGWRDALRLMVAPLGSCSGLCPSGASALRRTSMYSPTPPPRDSVLRGREWAAFLLGER